MIMAHLAQAQANYDVVAVSEPDEATQEHVSAQWDDIISALTIEVPVISIKTIKNEVKQPKFQWSHSMGYSY